MFVGRTGEYRIKRQKAGVGYFGQVKVRLVDAGDAAVIWRVPPEDTSSLQPGPDREFTEAAMAGAADGLRLVATVGVSTNGVMVEIVHVQLDFTDIEVSAVRTAAALAVAEAFGVANRLEQARDTNNYP